MRAPFPGAKAPLRGMPFARRHPPVLRHCAAPSDCRTLGSRARHPKPQARPAPGAPVRGASSASCAHPCLPRKSGNPPRRCASCFATGRAARQCAGWPAAKQDAQALRGRRSMNASLDALVGCVGSALASQSRHHAMRLRRQRLTRYARRTSPPTVLSPSRPRPHDPSAPRWSSMIGSAPSPTPRPPPPPAGTPPRWPSTVR